VNCFVNVSEVVWFPLPCTVEKNVLSNMKISFTLHGRGNQASPYLHIQSIFPKVLHNLGVLSGYSLACMGINNFKLECCHPICRTAWAFLFFWQQYACSVKPRLAVVTVTPAQPSIFLVLANRLPCKCGKTTEGA
jgi:hypothetical protein